jgi:hypothetical protein
MIRKLVGRLKNTYNSQVLKEHTELRIEDWES